MAASATAYDRAKQLVLDRQCIAFLGAGISHPPAQLWEQLVRELARCCRVTDLTGTNPEIVDRCIKKDRDACNRTLREELPKDTALIRTAVTWTMRLPFRAILTTNVDPWIRQQTVSDWQRACFIYPDLPFGGGMPGLYYLHGLFDADDRDACITKLVFGEDSFKSAYEESLLRGFLLNALTYEHVLFIGFNPREPRLSSILQKSRQIQTTISTVRARACETQKFVLWPEPDASDPGERAKQDAEVAELYALGLEPVFFRKEDNYWKGLDRTLLSWVEEGDAKNRPAPYKSGFDPK
jgi:hypothetical protein